MSLLAASPRLPQLLRATRGALAVAATAALAAGCGGSDDTLSPNELAGSYALVSVAGSALPYTLANANFRSELLSGVLTLRGDRTFDLAFQSRDTDLTTNTATVIDETYSGRYTLSGRVLTFTNTTNGELDGATASVSGATITAGDYTFRR